MAQDDMKTGSPEIGLGVLLRRANRSFAAVISANLARHGITHSQFHHLRRLWEQDGLSSSALSDLVEVKKATSTKILDALETQGLIRRERSATDRRKVHVFLTEKARALEPVLSECARDANRQAASRLSGQELVELYRLLGLAVEGLGAVVPGEEEDE
ncbi:MarR family transcriptional regulator [Arsenicitalea aurantiaca]|uniref:MarR family transcriptional regulator n=1 Tax=Arsenicitalea aurantiaca TaxID=1783274 RepID=A0A433XKS5_9HYPH|nr:MarR family transcriptional regulator [Arsenicitalea aurantiaca]RUT34690.1 MarR family transcriptional regulator [Arsenicitalea aurantiaca]